MATRRTLRNAGSTLGLALSLTLSNPVAWAQTGLAPASPGSPPTAPAPAASPVEVPPPLRPSPKVTSPSDAQRSMDLNNAQPEGKVTPQIRIPIGKKVQPPLIERRVPSSAGARPSTLLIGDDAARCDAERDAQQRAKCRDQVAHQGSK